MGRALTLKGIPTWVKEYSGVHISDRDRLNDGARRARIVCPILTHNFCNDIQCREELELALSGDRLVLPLSDVHTENFAEDWIRATFPEHTTTNADAILETVHMKTDLQDVDMDDIVLQLISTITIVGGVRQLSDSITSMECISERRKSFSDTQDDALNTNGLRQSKTLELIFSKDIGLDEGVALQYISAIRSYFNTIYGNDSDDNILLCSDEILKSIGIAYFPHRERILLWIEQQVT